MKIKTIVKLMGLTTPFIITACSTHTPKWQEESKDYEKSKQEFKDLKGQMHPKEYSVVEYNSGFYVDKTPIQIIKDKKDLPSIFYKETNLFAPNPLKFNDFAAEVFKQSKIIIKFIDNSQPAAQSNSSASTAQNNAYVPPPFPINTVDTNPVIQESIIEIDSMMSETADSIVLDYSGDLKGLLDYVAVKKNLKWKFDSASNKVYFYPFETETFTLFAVAEDIEMDSTITTNTASTNSSSSNSSGSEATSENEQKITFNQQQKYWDDVSTTVTGMLSSSGRVSLNKTQGKITVTDNDYNLAQVKSYVENLNNDAYKQITIDFKIVNLKLDDKRDIGINMNIINDKLSIGFGAGALTADNAFNSIGWDNGSGDNVLLNVLDTLGQVKVDTNISVVTVNNMPVPVQVTQNQAYIKKRSIQSGSVNSSPIEEVVTDTVSQGVTATITPKAIGQNVLLNYSMNLAVIDELATAPGDTKIQLPITSTKNFVQRLTLRNGESKVIAAFEKTDSKVGSKHPLASNLWFLGGQETLSKQKEIILLIATPYISTLRQ